jgi:glyoxylase-like metal-dependent hydrolase (beta-lactamase superfamily II)
VRSRLAVWVFLVTGCALAACSGAPAGLSNPLRHLRLAPPLPLGPPEHLGEDLTARTLGPKTYVITHAKPFPANSLVAELPDGTLVMVGTPYTPEATRQVLAWAQSKLGPRGWVSIHPHFHHDALGGVRALKEAGAKTYGSDLTVRMLNERGARARAQLLEALSSQPEQRARFEAFALEAPEHIFVASQGMELTFGGEAVRAIYPGPAHSPDNVVVQFPARNLLFGGCLVLTQARPGNLADAELSRWPGTLEVVRRLEYSTVVPGHGDRFDAELIDHTEKVVREALGQAPRGP